MTLFHGSVILPCVLAISDFALLHQGKKMYGLLVGFGLMFDKGQKQSSTLSCDSSYWSYFPLIIFDTISCPLYNLKTV